VRVRTGTHRHPRAPVNDRLPHIFCGFLARPPPHIPRTGTTANKANSILPRMRTRAAVSTRLPKPEASDSGNAVAVAVSHTHWCLCGSVNKDCNGGFGNGCWDIRCS
jgi:hypothetical protein